MDYFARLTREDNLQIKNKNEAGWIDWSTGRGFLDGLLETVETNSSIQVLTFENHILHVETFADYASGEYRSDSYTIEFIEPSYALYDFFDEIRKIVHKYECVKKITDKNLEDRIHRGLTYYLEQYLETATLPSEITEQTAKVFIEFIDSHKNNIIDNLSYFQRFRNFLSRIKLPFESNITKFLKILIPLVSILLFVATLVWSYGPIGIAFLVNSAIMLVYGGVKITNRILQRIGNHIIKKYENSINSFQDELIKFYQLDDVTLEQKVASFEADVEDMFIDFIKEDIGDISNKPSNEDYDNILKELNSLLLEYKIALNSEHLGGKTVDRFYFLSQLIAIEKKMYSINQSIGLIQDGALRFSEDVLSKRLKFLEGNLAFSIDDSCLKKIQNTLIRILSTPYKGYEKEILELLTIAQEYVQCNISSQKEVLTLNPEGKEKLLKGLNRIELAYQDDLLRAQKASALEKSLEALQTLASASCQQQEMSDSAESFSIKPV